MARGHGTSGSGGNLFHCAAVSLCHRNKARDAVVEGIIARVWPNNALGCLIIVNGEVVRLTSLAALLQPIIIICGSKPHSQVLR